MATVKDGARFSQLNLVSIWGSSERRSRSSGFDFDKTTLVGSEVSHSLRVKVEIYVSAFSLKIYVNLRDYTFPMFLLQRLIDLTNLKLYGKFKVRIQTTSLWFKYFPCLLPFFHKTYVNLNVMPANVNFRFTSLICFCLSGYTN